METDGQKELEAAQNSAEKEVDNLPESDQNNNVVESEIDESGAVEAAEYAGEQIAFEDDQDNLSGKNIADAVDKEILESVCNDAEEDRLKTPDLAAAPAGKHPAELPITHLKNPENKNKVFPATPDLMKRRDLVPCDENGKQVYDHRRLN